MNRTKATHKAQKWDHWQASAAIRDAVGLDAEHKSFLWNITSHKNMVEFSRREQVMRRTGLTDHKFRRVVSFLLDHQLIDAQRTPGGTTRYSIRMPALQALAHPGNPVAAANKGGRRQPPPRGMSVTVISPRRSDNTTRVASRHTGRVDARHQKNEREDVTEEIQKNRRTVTVRRPRGTRRDDIEDELEIFR